MARPKFSDPFETFVRCNRELVKWLEEQGWEEDTPEYHLMVTTQAALRMYDIECADIEKEIGE